MKQQQQKTTTVDEGASKLCGLKIEVNVTDLIRDFTKSELEKAINLRSQLSKDCLLIPFIDHYLERALFFLEVGELSRNQTQITKAFKRAYLSCEVIKYFLKRKRLNKNSSVRLKLLIKKGWPL